MLKPEGNKNIRTQPSRFGRRIRRAGLAALAFGSVASTDMIFSRSAYGQDTQSESVTRSIHDFERVGDDPFARSPEEALDDPHLESIYEASIQGGELISQDRNTFFERAIAARSIVRTRVQMMPGQTTPWMTGGSRVSGASTEVDLRWNGRNPLVLETFQVETARGMVVTYGIVVEVNPEDGTPCYNVEVVSVTPRVVVPPPSAGVSCPEDYLVTVRGGLPRRSEVVVTIVVQNSDRQLPIVGRERRDACAAQQMPEICEECTAGVAAATADEITRRRGQRFNVFSTQRHMAIDGSMQVRIPRAMRVPVRGDDGQTRYAYVDVFEAIRQGLMVLDFSCPQEPVRRIGRPGVVDRIGSGHSAIFDESDFTGPSVNVVYRRGEYHLAN